MKNRDRTVAEIFDNLNEHQKDIAYEIIGQALENGNYDREALVMFNKEEQVVMRFLLNEACMSNFRERCIKL